MFSSCSLISELLLSLLQIIAYYCNWRYFVQSLTLQHTYTGKIPTLLFTENPTTVILGNPVSDKRASRKLGDKSATEISPLVAGEVGVSEANYSRLTALVWTSSLQPLVGHCKHYPPKKGFSAARARGSNKSGADIDDLPRAPPKPTEME